VTAGFPPKVVAAGEGKTVMLFGVRFGYKVVSEDSGGSLAHRPAAEYYQLAVDYGITIQDDWIEELERTYGVKL
jgi:hypothetical protein